MRRQNVIAMGLLVVVFILIMAVAGAPRLPKRWRAVGLSGSGATASLIGNSISSDSSVIESDAPVAPEFTAGTWINSEPLTMKSLRGRVVVVEFWTFGCYNCRNTLPAVKRLHERYSDKGLTIVGVHSPEFDREKKIENVRREVASLGIRYPVVTDNDYETWRAYNVEAWPTTMIIDKLGRVRFAHVGEGKYKEIETAIQELLAEKS